MKVRTWRVRTTRNGTVLPSNFLVSQDWDPTLPDPATPNVDTWRLYRAFDNVDVILRPGETYERSMHLPSQKLDVTGYNANQNRDFWCVCVQNVSTNVNNPASAVTSHNLSFTGDRVV